jgi:hypothetical protein
MKICEYGCGQKGIYRQTNGKMCCSEFYSQCPEIRRKTSEAQKGIKRKPLTEETKRKIGESNKGNKLGPQSEELKRKKSESLKGRFLKEESSQWKGGIDIGTQHKRAWELFGKDYCEICGISLNEYKKKSNRRFLDAIKKLID